MGDKTTGPNEELHPLASAATSTPPQLPLGDETPRNNPLASAVSSTPPQIPLGGGEPEEKEDLPLRDETPRNKRRASLGGRNPGDNNNDNAQPSRVRSKKRKIKGSWTQTRTMVIKYHGHIKNHGHNDKNETTKMTPNHQD